jgi:hypothetical protein
MTVLWGPEGYTRFGHLLIQRRLMTTTRIRSRRLIMVALGRLNYILLTVHHPPIPTATTNFA